MRQKHATMRRASKSHYVNGVYCDMRCASKSHYVNGAYCDMRLSQESWMISTFACRTNKPVYTARFCRISFVASCKRTLSSHGWRMRLARCLSPLSPKLSPVGRGYSWMGDLGIASCWFSKKRGTHVSRVVVVGLSRASRVFFRVLRFSFLRKINT